MIGRPGEPPVPPVNLVGDFGGGGMLLAFGMVCGMLEACRSGEGQVIDAAMVDGAALLAAMMWGFKSAGFWGERGTNLLDGGAWYYGTYETRRRRVPVVRVARAAVLRRDAAHHRARRRRRRQGTAARARATGTRGRPCRSAWRPSSRPESRDEWCARPRGHRRLLRPGPRPSTKPPATRTWRSGGRSSRSAAWCSQRPPRASAGRPARSPARRPDPARTPTRPLPTGVLGRRGGASCASSGAVR